MKKVVEKISIVLMIVMLAMIVVPNVKSISSTGATFSISQTTVKQGETVSLNVMISDISGEIGAYSYEITYDSSKLEVIEDESSLFAGTVMGNVYSANYRTNGKILVGGMSTIGVTSGGRVATLKFKVKDNATGEASVSINISKLVGTDFETIPSKVSSNGKVIIDNTSDNVEDETIETLLINKTSLTLNKGASETLTTNQTNVTWSSSNTSVATVNNGKVTAVGTGSTLITAKYGSLSVICTVNVNSSLTGITINKNTLSLTVNQSETLKLTLSPSDTTDSKTATWSSSNSKIASVDSNGKVTAKSTGTATITVKVGTYSKTCVVKISDIIEETQSDEIIESETEIENELYIEPSSVTIMVDEEMKLIAMYNGEKLQGDYIWNSDNEEIVQIDEDGNIVALKVGVANISVIYNDITATIIVEVTDEQLELISILESNNNQFQIGKQYKLEYIIKPESLNEKYNVIWSIDNDEIGTISEEGIFIGLKEGRAIITAYINNEIFATYEIEVTEENIDNEINYIYIIIGMTFVIITIIVVKKKVLNIKKK